MPHSLQGSVCRLLSMWQSSSNKIRGKDYLLKSSQSKINSARPYRTAISGGRATEVVTSALPKGSETEAVWRQSYATLQEWQLLWGEPGSDSLKAGNAKNQKVLRRRRMLRCGLLAKSCLTVCNAVDCSPSDSSVHGILQARILKWIDISFSRDLPKAGDQTFASRIGRRRL